MISLSVDLQVAFILAYFIMLEEEIGLKESLDMLKA